MHLARIDGDDVADTGFHMTNTAPRAMSIGVEDTDAEVVMGMPRKGKVGDQ